MPEIQPVPYIPKEEIPWDKIMPWRTTGIDRDVFKGPHADPVKYYNVSSVQSAQTLGEEIFKLEPKHGN